MYMDTSQYVRRVLTDAFHKGCIYSQALHDEPAYIAQSLELRKLLIPLKSLAEQLERDESYGLHDNAIWLNGEHLRDFIWDIEAWTETVGIEQVNIADELRAIFNCFQETLQHAVFVADVVEYRSAWVHDAMCRSVV